MKAAFVLSGEISGGAPFALRPPAFFAEWALTGVQTPAPVRSQRNCCPVCGHHESFAGEAKVGDRVHIHLAAGRCRKGGGQLRLIERRPLRALGRIDQNERHAAGAAVAIPETAIRQRGRVVYAVIDQRVDVVVHELFRVRVVVRR